MSKLISALCEMFDITRHHSSAYHPCTNSSSSFLHAAMMAFRMAPAAATGFSPLHLVFGKEMNLPIDTSLIPKISLGMDAQHFFAQLLQNLKVAKEIAGTNMKIAQEKSKQHHDKKAKMQNFKVGDWVLLKSMKVPKGHSPKLYPKHEGPFYITELGPNFTFKLTSCADHTEVKCLINASRLKRYVKVGRKTLRNLLN